MSKNRDLESLIDIVFYGRQALSFVDDLPKMNLKGMVRLNRR